MANHPLLNMLVSNGGTSSSTYQLMSSPTISGQALMNARYLTSPKPTLVSLFEMKRRFFVGDGLVRHEDGLSVEAQKWIADMIKHHRLRMADAISPFPFAQEFDHRTGQTVTKQRLLHIGTLYVKPEKATRKLPFREYCPAFAHELILRTRKGETNEALASFIRTKFNPVYGDMPSRAALYLLKGVVRDVVSELVDKRPKAKRLICQDPVYHAMHSYGLLNDVAGRRSPNYNSNTSRTSMLGLALLKQCAEEKTFKRYYEAYVTKKAEASLVSMWVDKVLFDEKPGIF